MSSCPIPLRPNEYTANSSFLQRETKFERELRTMISRGCLKGESQRSSRLNLPLSTHLFNHEYGGNRFLRNVDYVDSIRFLIIHVQLPQYEPPSWSAPEERIKIFEFPPPHSNILTHIPTFIPKMKSHDK